jgi:hypothetical protein
MRKATLKYFIAANAAVFAMVAAPAAIDHFYGTDLGWMPSAYAGDSVPKGQAGKPSDKGQMGKGGPSQDVGGQGQGQGGPGVDSDAKGPRYGGSGTGQKGGGAGKPVWAQEGIPEVELGRLNVIRAPASVYDRQLAEAFKAITADEAILEFYKLTVADIEKLDLDTVVRLDSPLANLALLRDLLADGKIEVAGQTLTLTTDLQAILLGSASDKTVPISADTVTAIYTIIGYTQPYDAAAIAAAAEVVRQNILYDHDN